MTESLAPAVSVIIPTTGRHVLNRAIRSVLDQRDVSVEVIVVWDGDESSLSISQIEFDWANRVRVVDATGTRNGAKSRDIGTELARSPWVAYLDDDDYWFPSKLRVQLDAMMHDRQIVSCRLACLSGASGLASGVAPLSVYANDRPIEDWLFRSRSLSGQRNLLQTSTLVLSRELARAIGWASTARRHEDWDFVIRGVKLAAAEVVQVPEVLVAFTVGSTGSVSGRDAWRDSLDWVDGVSGDWDSRTLSDFIVAQPVRYALQSGDWRAVPNLLRRVANSGMPSWRSCALGAAGLLPRHRLEALMFATVPGHRRLAMPG